MTKVLLEKWRKVVDKIIGEEHPSFNNIIVPLEEMKAEMEGTILKDGKMKEMDKIRKLCDRCSIFEIEVYSNPKLYNQICSLNNKRKRGNDTTFSYIIQLTDEEKRLILYYTKVCESYGCKLSLQERKIFVDKCTRFANLGEQFHSNRESSDNYITFKEEDLEGLSKEELEYFRGEGWKVGYFDIQLISDKCSKNETRLRIRDLLGKIEENNRDILKEIISLKKEVSQLLGFNDWNSFRYSSSCIGKDELEGWLDRCFQLVSPFCCKTLREIEAVKGGRLEYNDYDYWSRVYIEKEIGISDEELSEFFPLEKVYSGIVEVISNLFSIRIVETEKIEIKGELFHTFDVYDKSGNKLGSFYKDLEFREDKIRTPVEIVIPGCITGGKRRYPLCGLVCQFENEFLLWSDIEELTEKFGMVIREMYSGGRGKYTSLTTISEFVEYDFGDIIPSFFKTLLLERDHLMKLVDNSGEEKISPSIIDKLIDVRRSLNSIELCKSIAISLVDFELYKSNTIEEIKEYYNMKILEIVGVDMGDGRELYSTVNLIGESNFSYHSLIWGTVVANNISSLLKSDKIKIKGLIDFMSKGVSLDGKSLVRSLIGEVNIEKIVDYC